MAKPNIITRSRKKKALAALETNQLDEARALLEQVSRADSLDADAWGLLGTVAARQGRYAEAVSCLEKAVELRPKHAETQFDLGNILLEVGHLEDACRAFRRACQLKPDYGQAWERLGHALMRQGEITAAEQAMRAALCHSSGNSPGLQANLGALLQMQSRLEEAADCYLKAQRINPGIAHENLGGVLTSQGRLKEAFEIYRRGIKFSPNNAGLRSNFLTSLNYGPHLEPSEILAEHRAWGEILGKSSPRPARHTNSRDPERKLRVGYVSPDFRSHSVAYFFEPLLAAHDSRSVETVCYSNLPRPDEVTRRLKRLAGEWREISALSDDQVVAMIQEAGIDLLVDLAGYTNGNRIGVFAHRPAPVQLTWLGYPNTTGLSAMDYRITDELADPPGEEQWFTETLVRLPGCFLCYQPLPEAPPASGLPAGENGCITFGSFNNLAKINPEVVALWAQVVLSVPDARLLIKNPSFTDAATRDRYRALFEEQGLPAGSLELVGHTPTPAEHLALYSRIDIALDTFPYNGTTTTCEALWMGVPVVTLLGEHHAGRVSASILKAIGRSEWVAESGDQYQAIARELATDTCRLADTRSSLRELVTLSPLRDADAFARKMEVAYRDMWQEWCQSGLT